MPSNRKRKHIVEILDPKTEDIIRVGHIDAPDAVEALKLAKQKYGRDTKMSVYNREDARSPREGGDS